MKNEALSNIKGTIHNVHLAVMVATVAANTPSIILLVSHHKLRKKHSIKFFVNLELVHLGFALYNLAMNFQSWYMEMYIDNAFLLMMILSLIMITFERYFAIKYPYLYGKMTNTHVNDVIICSWIPALVFIFLAAIFHFSLKHNALMTTVLLAVSWVILSAWNLVIWVCVRKNICAINKHMNENLLDRVNVSKEKKRLKSAYVSFGIVISFLLLYLPYLLHDLLLLTKTFSTLNKMFTELIEPFAHFNSFIDPVLFVCFRQDIKKELRRLWGMKCKCLANSEFGQECIPMSHKYSA